MRHRLARLFPLLLLGLASCDAARGPELSVVRRIAIPSDSASALFVDAGERLWLGGGGALLRVEPSGEAVRLPLQVEAPPRVIGRRADRLFVRAGERLLSLEPASESSPVSREGIRGVVLLDVRGRFLVWSTPSGSVLGLDPGSLEPQWIWPSLGASVAAALSPEGDRLYQALTRGEDAALVARDLQTGREMHGEVLSAPVSALHGGPGGELIAIVGSPGEEVVLSLQPVGGELRSRWRTRLRSLGLAAPVEVRVSPAGGDVALFSPGNESGLRVLDAETGDLVGGVDAAVRDAAFGSDGASLYLLAGPEVRVVRARR